MDLDLSREINHGEVELNLPTVGGDYSLDVRTSGANRLLPSLNGPLETPPASLCRHEEQLIALPRMHKCRVVSADEGKGELELEKIVDGRGT